MRALIRLLLIGLLSVLPSLGQAQTWPNEPSGATVLTDANFSATPPSGWTAPFGAGTIVTDATAPISPPNVLRYLYNTGCSCGGGDITFDFSNTDEIFVGMSAKIDSNFIGYSNLHNKIMPFWLGDGSIFWLEIIGSQGGPFHPAWVLQVNDGLTNNCHISSDGDCPGPVNWHGSGTFTKNTFHRIEVYGKKSTTRTSQNGILRVWMDGTLVLSSSAVNFPNGGQFDFVQLTPSWDGSDHPSPGRTNADEWQFDHVHISTPSGGSDTTPPTQVTGLTATAGNGQIQLNWVAASDNVGIGVYNIEQQTGCTGNFVGIAQANALGHLATGLTNGTSYCFRVAAQDLAGNIGPYSATVSATPTGSQVFRETLATDTFDRANNADLGAAWDAGYDGRNPFKIENNLVRHTTLGVDAVETYNAISTPNNQWAMATLTTIGGSFEASPGVLLRMANSPTFSGYECRTSNAAGGGPSRIARWNNQAFTVLAEGTVVTNWANGDKVRCEADLVSGNNTIRFYRVTATTETLLMSAIDNTHTSGKTGIINFTHASGSLGDIQLNDFTVGGWTTTPPAAPRINSIVTSATGLTLTYGATTPTTIRIQTDLGSTLYPIASFPGGVLSRVWVTGETFACAFARDSAGIENTNPADYQCAAVTPIDTTPPTTSNVAPVGLTLASGTTSVTISLNTNKNATCRHHSSDVAYASMPSANQFTNTGTTSHSTLITGLVNSTAYMTYIRCIDLAGNAMTSSVTSTYSVETPPATDTTPPSTVTGFQETVITSTQITYAWTAATDANGIAFYRLYTCAPSNCAVRTVAQTISSPTVTTTLGNLTPGNPYTTCVTAVDTFGNESAACSNVVTATTISSGDDDLVPPSTVTGFTTSPNGIFFNSLELTWTAGTDIGTGIQHTLIQRCKGAGCTNFTAYASATGTSFTDTIIEPLTTYRYQAKFIDGGGNVSTAYSSILTVTTPAVPASITHGLCPCRRHTP